MIPLSLAGLDHFGWLYEPDWTNGITARFQVEADTVSGLTKRENRRALSESLRVELDASFAINGREAAACRNALRALQDAQVRLPFWPGLNDAALSSANMLSFDDGPTNVGWAGGRENSVPTLLGHFAEPPTFKAIDPNTFKVDVNWRESSASAEQLQVSAQEWEAGPSIGGRTVYQFPFLPDWSSDQDPGQVVVDVTREALGFSRQRSSAAYPQAGYRRPTFGFTLTAGEPAQLLRFFLDRHGPVEAFWLPVWVRECNFISSVGNQVTVSDASALGDHRYIMLHDDFPILRKIVSIAGNVLTLDADPGVLTETTIICTLALARFASGQLSIKWVAPDLAQAQIAFQEVSQEYLTPLGEESGETLGALPAKAFLFEIRHGAETWHWTSYERDLVYDGETYTAPTHGGIDFEEITDGMAWDTSSCRLKMRCSADNPLLRLVRRTATDRMEVIIAEVAPGDPATGYSVIFRGWFTQATFNGPWIDADATGFGSLFSRKIPRTLMQPTDNYALFDAGNRLVLEDWTFSASLTESDGTALTFDTMTWPQGALPAIGAHYFALGYLESPEGQRVPVIDSEALADGVLAVTAAFAVDAESGAGWKLIPGYDGLPETAEDKFGNLANFGGFPEVPDTDPSMIPIKKDNSTGGKK